MGNDESSKEENMNPHRVVIGIDPASGKDSHVFAPELDDGIDRSMTPSELRRLLPSPRTTTEKVSTPFGVETCLVCWDAPLTGPPYPDADDPGVMTMRSVEATKNNDNEYFDRVATWAKDRKGVALRPFSGLSHWVITRNLLGLPRTGIFDAPFSELPLYPVFTREALNHYRFAVTEVHPALAVAAWLGEDFEQYKHVKKGESTHGNSVLNDLWKKIRDKVQHRSRLPELRSEDIKSDDAFDARVAWLLGYLWLRGNTVKLVGNEQDGSFLLPNDQTTSN